MNYKLWVWGLHIFFWAVLSILVGFIFYLFVSDVTISISATLISTICWILLVYGNFLFLIPRFYNQNRYWEYFFYLLILIFITASIRFFGGWGLVIEMGWDLEDEFTPTFFGSTIFGSLFILLISFPLVLLDNWFKRQELEKELKTQQLEAELRFLKAQVNPHFLFNALNNIYSLSFTESKKAPEMILKLSDMMSYMLYECKGKMVNLSSEVAYLKNYIDLQQLKKDGEQNIDFKIEGDISGIQIPPMLFIPFFENAFKHGNLEDVESGWLKSNIAIKNEALNFYIANSLGQNKKKFKQGGVGLDNIQKRLALLYPDIHELKILENKDTFKVQLSIDLSSPISQS